MRIAGMADHCYNFKHRCHASRKLKKERGIQRNHCATHGTRVHSWIACSPPPRRQGLAGDDKTEPNVGNRTTNRETSVGRIHFDPPFCMEWRIGVHPFQAGQRDSETSGPVSGSIVGGRRHRGPGRHGTECVGPARGVACRDRVWIGFCVWHWHMSLVAICR